MQHDGCVREDPQEAIRPEVVLVTRPVPAPAPGPLDALRHVLLSSVGMAAATAATVASVVEQTVATAVESSVNAALDRLVPVIVDAVVERIDLTGIVLDQVDLDLIVTRALDGLDLTQLVIDRVDVNEIVAQADVNAVIDRVPIIPLANYVIEEIDLPQIIRSSTGGIATDAVNAVRVQGVNADQFVSRLADRMLLRRRQRDVEAPGEPESLIGRMRADFGADARHETVTNPSARIAPKFSPGATLGPERDGADQDGAT